MTPELLAVGHAFAVIGILGLVLSMVSIFFRPSSRAYARLSAGRLILYFVGGVGLLVWYIYCVVIGATPGPFDFLNLR